MALNPDGSWTSPTTGRTFTKEEMNLMNANSGNATYYQNKATPKAYIQKPAGSIGIIQQKTLAQDPSATYVDSSGREVATVSSKYGVDDVQVSQVEIPRSINKNQPIYITGKPEFGPNTDPNNTQVSTQAQEARYEASVPHDKILLEHISPLSIFGVVGTIAGEKLYPKESVTSLVDSIPKYVSEKLPETPNKTWENIIPWTAVAVSSLPAFGVGAINTANIYATKLFTPTIFTEKQKTLKESTTLGLENYAMYDFDRNVLGLTDSVKENPTKTFVSMLGPAVVLGGTGIASGRISGVVRTIGKEKLPIEKYGYTPEVGYPINPKGTNPKTVLKSFEENTLIPKPIKMSKSDTVPYVPKNAILPNTKLVGSERLMYTGWETDTPVKVGKKYTLPNVTSSETSGIYGAPVMQTSYTKVSTKMSNAIGNMIGADLSNPFSKRPTIIATKVSSLEAVPKQLRTQIGSKEFIETKSKAGVAYADLYKAEYQAILASGQEVKVTGKNYYVKVGGFGKSNFLGKRIPITEQEVTGRFIKPTTTPKSGKSKSSQYSYDINKSSPLINTAYILWTPTKSTKKSTTEYKTTKQTATYTGYPTSKTVSAKTLDYAPSGASYKQTSTNITPISSTFKQSTTYKPPTSTTKYKTTPTKTTPTITPISSTPSPTKRTPTITPISSTPSPTKRTTSKYTPPKFVPPKYTIPKYKDKQTKQKPPKPTKYKQASLFKYTEKTKSRSIQSILGIKIPKTPRIPNIKLSTKLGRKKR